jgi:hypothetical protein
VDFARDPSVACAATGRFTIAVRSGRAEHHARAHGFAPDERTHDVVPGEQDHEWLIVLRRGSSLRGTVLDADGKPLAGARVAPGHGPRGASLAVVTAADGSFELQDLGSSADVRIDAKGHLPLLVTSFATAGEPLVARLERPERLAGTVRGPGAAAALVTLDWDYPARFPDWIWERIHPRATAADGSFAFEELPPGKFTLRAQVGDRARSRTVEVAVPQGGPVTLELEASAEHAITVLDETGRPIAGAGVALRDRDEHSEKYEPGAAHAVFERPLSSATTGQDGKAALRGPAWRSLILAVRGDDCAPVVAAFAADCAPAERNRIVRTTRCGRVAGELAGPAVLARASAWIEVRREGDDPEHGLASRCDANGQFLSPPVPPGSYSLWLALDDQRRRSQERQPGNEPLLAPLDWRQRMQRIAVCRVVAGTTTRLEAPLVLPPLGALEGVVLASGRGVAGVRVFAVEPGTVKRRREREELLGRRGYLGHPNALTDAHGKFRFVDPDGRAWELWARARESDATVGPLAVAAEAPGATRRVTVRLPEGAVTGTFALAGIPLRDREWLEAYLFPIAMAEHDVIYSPYEGLPLTSGRHVQHVGMSGRFTFPFLASGRYVLRVVNGFEGLVCQRVCDVGEGATVDLGGLAPDALLAARVPCHVEDATGAWIRAPDPGNPRGVWVGTARVEAGALSLEHLAPGKYLVEPFARTGWRADRSISGSSLGRTVDLELRADGTTWPAEIR